MTYKFTTLHGDIGYGINFIPNDNSRQEIEVLPMTRCPSDIEEIVGTYKAPAEGIVIIYWDNSFSWFTPKNLSYTIEVAQVNNLLPLSLRPVLIPPCFCSQHLLLQIILEQSRQDI